MKTDLRMLLKDLPVDPGEDAGASCDAGRICRLALEKAGLAPRVSLGKKVLLAAAAALLLGCGLPLVYRGAVLLTPENRGLLDQPRYVSSSPEAEPPELHLAESTDKVDVDTFELCPQVILEVEAAEDGSLPQVLYDNGSALILTRPGGEPWTLKKGEELTLELLLEAGAPDPSWDTWTMELGYIRDREAAMIFREEVDRIGYTFSAPEDGEYYFYLYHWSSDPVLLSQGSIARQ